MVAHKLKEAIRSKCSVVEAEEILLDLQSPMSDSLGVCDIILWQYFAHVNFSLVCDGLVFNCGYAAMFMLKDTMFVMASD